MSKYVSMSHYVEYDLFVHWALLHHQNHFITAIYTLIAFK